MSSWRNITVGNLGEVITGYTPPTTNAEYFGGVYPFITPTDITIDSRTVQTERFLSQKGYEYNKNRLLPQNTVCVTCIGATIGKTCMTTVPSVTNQQINSIVVNQDKYDPYFVFYLLITKTDVLQSVANKATTPIVNKSTFASIHVYVPPLSTQRKIVKFLDRKTEQIDELIRIKERRIELLQEQRTALINQSVTKGLAPNVEMKPSGVEWIGEIPKHWKKSRFKYESLVPVQYGLNISSDLYVEQGIRFIRTTDITDHGELIDKGVYLETEAVEKIYLTQPNDFLISRSGTLGRTYLHQSDEKHTYGGYLVRFNFGCSIKSRFIFYFTKSLCFEHWIALNTIQSTIGNVNGQKYSNLEIFFPSFTEQTQIVNFLDSKTKQIDELITTERRKIELLKEYRQSLISEAVTGKIDVRNEV